MFLAFSLSVIAQSYKYCEKWFGLTKVSAGLHRGKIASLKIAQNENI